MCCAVLILNWTFAALSWAGNQASLFFGNIQYFKSGNSWSLFVCIACNDIKVDSSFAKHALAAETCNSINPAL